MKPAKKRSSARREVWVVVNDVGEPDLSCAVFPNEESAQTWCGDGYRVVRYIPAPTKRKRRRGK